MRYGACHFIIERSELGNTSRRQYTATAHHRCDLDSLL